MKKSELKKIIREEIQSLNEVGGRGFFELKRGLKITSKNPPKKGDVILAHSKQFNADNTFKIVNIRKYNTVIQYDAIYWNPTSNKRIGNENTSIELKEFDRGNDIYWRPKK